VWQATKRAALRRLEDRVEFAQLRADWAKMLEQQRIESATSGAPETPRPPQANAEGAKRVFGIEECRRMQELDMLSREVYDARIKLEVLREEKRRTAPKLKSGQSKDTAAEKADPIDQKETDGAGEAKSSEPAVEAGPRAETEEAADRYVADTLRRDLDRKVWVHNSMFAHLHCNCCVSLQNVDETAARIEQGGRSPQQAVCRTECWTPNLEAAARQSPLAAARSAAPQQHTACVEQYGCANGVWLSLCRGSSRAFSAALWSYTCVLCVDV